MLKIADLTKSPNPLARHYTRFRVAERLLLIGHSHQAWPDCSLEAQLTAWLDAAEHLGAKWSRAEEKAERVRRGFAELMEDTTGHYALGANTHELVVRFLSALPLRSRPRLVTTDGEFHSLRRQLTRLAEEGLEVVRVAAHPADSVAGRLVAEVDDRTAAVLASAVFFETGQIAGELGEVARVCRRHGVPFLIDAYHALNVMPFPLLELGLEDAFVVGGGYKYCQLGEGNCFLRLPAGCRMRPIVTGWFAEDASLDARPGAEEVTYAEGATRFAGATYDPTSHYRAASVFDFFSEQRLTPGLLRALSQHQIRLLAETFDRLDLDPRVIDRPRAVDLTRIGGFLALHSPSASRLQQGLLAKGVDTDVRGTWLRFGPAPYLSDDQLREAMLALEPVVRAVMSCAERC